MPVKLRITLLFALIVMILLGLVCGSVYYFSYNARMETIKTRLTNRAITIARLLGQKETFDTRLILRIDSLTSVSLNRKTVEAYDYQNHKIYSYTDIPNDTLPVSKSILDDARVNGSRYFTSGGKEAIAYHYSDENTRVVVISAAKDMEGRQILNTLRNILVSSFLVGIAFVVITGYFFSRRLLQPIREITSDLDDISARNLARRIKTGTSRDEWFHLASTLNKLLNRLQESFDVQRRFISNASHELSTPLTSVSSQLEVSLQKERAAEEYRRVMQSVYQDVRHMSQLTKALLEFAKASGNAGGLEISQIRVDEILLRLPAEMAKIDGRYSVLLEFGQLPENAERLTVPGNEPLLLTAIKNVVYNACKYSDNHEARVTLQAGGEELIIIIADKGRGIPARDLERIFQPFYRVEDNLPTEGFGLGLSLADRIIKLHKGRIRVSSEPGKGTEFTISFQMSSP